MLLPETPFATLAAEEPIFKLESRRIKWGVDADTLRRCSRKRLLLIVGILLLICGVILVGGLAAGNAQDLSGSIRQLSPWLVILWLFGNVYMDFVTLSMSIEDINREIISGRWDLLRLANISSERLVSSKHGVAQLWAWLPVMNVVSVRIAICVIIVLGLFLDNDQRLIDVISGILGAVLVAWGLFSEPIWRMRAVTAVGLWASSRTRNSSFSLSLAIVTTFALSLLQPLFIGVGLIVAFVSASPLMLPVILINSDGLYQIWMVLIGCTCFGISIYWFYSSINRWFLSRIVSRLAKMEM